MKHVKRINFYLSKVNEYFDSSEVRIKFPNRLERLVKYREALKDAYANEKSC
ncbi:hypothetical protein [Carnobacterium divergens]|uniref:hypothetical protein n=1 Tax=Carnobacterium divergens TaxID=2748 RepID=UPI0014304CCB|nr:hypothetical protein [Carnobacterium divergens]